VNNAVASWRSSRALGLIGLTAAIVLLIGCGDRIKVAVEIRCASVEAMQGAILLRVPAWRAIQTTVRADGLWRELPAADDQLAVIGFHDPGVGRWRFSDAAMQGEASRPDEPPLSEAAERRWARFFTQVRDSAAVRDAPDEVRAAVLAAHLTRALATDLLAKFRLRAAFVRFDARAPGLENFTADAIRDLHDLVGPRGVLLLWLVDEDRAAVFTNDAAALPGRESASNDVVSLLAP
jgi:hypothetical protein